MAGGQPSWSRPIPPVPVSLQSSLPGPTLRDPGRNPSRRARIHYTSWEAGFHPVPNFLSKEIKMSALHPPRLLPASLHYSLWPWLLWGQRICSLHWHLVRRWGLQVGQPPAVIVPACYPWEKFVLPHQRHIQGNGAFCWGDRGLGNLGKHFPAL